MESSDIEYWPMVKFEAMMNEMISFWWLYRQLSDLLISWGMEAYYAREADDMITAERCNGRVFMLLDLMHNIARFHDVTKTTITVYQIPSKISHELVPGKD